MTFAKGTATERPKRAPRKPLELTDKHQKYLQITPVSARSTVERTFRHTGSASNAIKAKCLVCCNFDRDEVRNC